MPAPEPPVAPHAVDARLDALCTGLRERGYCIVDDLLPHALLRTLAADCAWRERSGVFKRAGTGRGASAMQNALRDDSIHWLEPGATEAPATDFLAQMDMLRVGLNRGLLLGLHELEAHYAVYPAGGGYARHRDRFRDDDARVLSLVVYLNPDWDMADGGQLRLHLEDGALDVAPAMGCSVLFLSDAIEHEVLPAQRTRRSIAGWFRQRPLS
jgi:SM-20-related protein